MTNLEIARLRLRNQRLSRASFERPDEVVRWFGALQAQNFMFSLWGVGLRMSGATQSDVEQAIANRTIVRTWPMRGTIHFVPAEDAFWMVGLLARRPARASGAVYRKAGLDDTALRECRRVLERVLVDGPMTRKELYSSLDDAGLEATRTTAVGSRGMHIVARLAIEGVICFGPRRRKQTTVVLLQDWVPEPRRLEREEALAELTTRYLRSHGPATAYDFSWWSGLTVKEARSAIKLVSSDFQTLTIDGNTYWFDTDTTEPTSTTNLYLLPYLDELTVGYRDRTAHIDPRHVEELENSGPSGILGPVIVRDGQVVGTWSRKFERDSVSVKTKLFDGVDGTASALPEAVHRFSEFVELPVKE